MSSADCAPAARKVLSEESEQRLQTVVKMGTKAVYNITLHEGPLLNALKRIYNLKDVRRVSITEPDAYAEALYMEKTKKALKLASWPYIIYQRRNRNITYRSGLSFHQGDLIFPFTIDGRFTPEMTSGYELYSHLHWDRKTRQINILGLYSRSHTKHPHIYIVVEDGHNLRLVPSREYRYTIGTEPQAIENLEHFTSNPHIYKYHEQSIFTHPRVGDYIRNRPLVRPKLGFQTLTREESETVISVRIDTRASP